MRRAAASALVAIFYTLSLGAPCHALESLPSSDAGQVILLPCDDPNSDLCQQHRMAIAAEELVMLTKAEIVFLILTFLGTLALGLITLRTSQKQLRAYITFDAMDVTPPTRGQPLRYQLRLRNSGQTPAKNTAGIHSICLRSIPLKIPFENLDGMIKETTPKRDLGAGDTTDLQGKSADVWSEIDEQKFQNGEAVLYVLGRVEYRDQFGGKRWTNFRFSGTPDGNVIRWWATDEGNESN